jgi:hypothetical protein
MKRALLVIIGLVFTSLVFASSLARIYQEDNPVLHQINQLSLEAGLLPLPASAPLTGYDLHNQVMRLKGQSLSPYSLNRLDEIENTLLNPLRNEIAASITISPEIYANTNELAKEWDWVDRYASRAPFLSGEAEALLGTGIYGIFNYSLEKRLFEEDFQRPSTNFPYLESTSETNVQNSVPHTAFMAFSGDSASIVFGRDTLGWGQGNTGNLTLGNHVPYHDFFIANTSKQKLRYTFLALPMNELDSNGDAVIPFKPEASAFSNNWQTLFHGTLARIFLAHRLELSISPRVRVSLTEGTMHYTDRLDIRMFNPLMFLHNYQNYGEVNNTMTLELETALKPGLFLDFQFFLDQFQTGGELDSYSEVPPNAYAGLVGLRFGKPTLNGTISGYFEGVYTSPYVYLRAGDNTHNYEGVDEDHQYNLDLVHSVNMRAGAGSVNYLGYRYGSDSIVLAGKISFEHHAAFALYGDVRFIVQGERGIEAEDKTQLVNLDPDELNRLTPSGDNPTFSLITGFGGSLTLPDTNVLVHSKAFLINTWDTAGTYRRDLQISMGASVSLKVY